ncbi:hypothetical protein ACQKP0_13550 [Heyndrickxia sp. NPDC080065]|uniref:hypothetical protein n=1 Tax=Heyndrickxia sp. NPDC080065 TaxID=3390568 RepID=UPI003D05B440
MAKTALLTVTHDPNGRNIDLFMDLHKNFEEIYSEIFITISDESSITLIKEIEKSNFRIKIIPKQGAAHARREVLKFGLSGESQYFHYCDFDRILTWGKNHLNELKKVVSDIPKYHYLILGRTERALNTHPIEWIETEKITNKIFSLEIGKKADITAGSSAFSRVCAKYLNKYSKGKMTDAEWAMIIHRIGNLKVDYRSVEGLEYCEDINSINSNISDSEKWLGRLKLSLIISETAINTGK